MPSFNFVLLTIIGCTIVTWLSRVIPFVLLKKFQLSKTVEEYLSFVPIVIMASLWFTSLFHQHLGSLPTINWENFLASIPSVLAAFISKSLLVVVIVGIISLAIIRLI
ncbi:AzlD domain-containing protein [Apilactobacillus apinorum]|uniref:AzlD domain-containing protein n=1 Tax=Apilactobacillus apinorum TaxID=1218495 RepID=A0ABP9ZIC2_9LACO